MKVSDIKGVEESASMDSPKMKSVVVSNIWTQVNDWDLSYIWARVLTKRLKRGSKSMVEPS